MTQYRALQAAECHNNVTVKGLILHLQLTNVLWTYTI